MKWTSLAPCWCQRKLIINWFWSTKIFFLEFCFLLFTYPLHSILKIINIYNTAKCTSSVCLPSVRESWLGICRCLLKLFKLISILKRSIKLNWEYDEVKRNLLIKIFHGEFQETAKTCDACIVDKEMDWTKVLNNFSGGIKICHITKNWNDLLNLVRSKHNCYLTCQYICMN